MERKTNKRYILIALLFFHTVNTYMDRICISAASDLMKSDLGISNQMMGYVFSDFCPWICLVLDSDRLDSRLLRP